MTDIDRQNEMVLKKLPLQRLSSDADRLIRRKLSSLAVELGYKKRDWGFLQRLIAVPAAFALLLASTVGYAATSDSVVSGDMLFSVKVMVEDVLYPETGSAEKRIAYHLWLSDRRYAEVFELLKRRSFAERKPLVFLPNAEAAGTNSVLDRALQLTLRAAHRNTEAAVEISTEIADISRLKAVHLDIQQTVTRQKVALEQLAPVLQAIEVIEVERPLPKSTFTMPREEAVREEAAADSLAEMPSSSLSAPRTLQELVRFETEQQETLLERLSQTVSNAEKEGKQQVNILYLIPEEDRLFQQKPLPVPTGEPFDRFERVIEEANQSHQQAKKMVEEEYERLFIPLEDTPNTDPSAGTDEDGQGRTGELDTETREQEEEVVPPTPAFSPYEPPIPFKSVETSEEEVPERLELDKEKAPLKNEVPPVKVPRTTVAPPSASVDSKYEPKIPVGAEEPSDSQLEQERGMLERE